MLIEYDTPMSFICGQKFKIGRHGNTKTFILVGVGNHQVQALYTPEYLLGCGKKEVFSMSKISPIEVFDLFGGGDYNYCTLQLDGELMTEIPW